MPHLLYIGQTPAEGTGSPVIVLRHLQRLAAAGWRVTIVAERGQDPTACQRANWQVLTLPLRRFWWPPFRRALPVSRTLRTWLLARECQRRTAAHPADAVLGYLAAHDDFYAEIAARAAGRMGVPLSLLVHDKAAAFASAPAANSACRRRQAWIVRQAHRCWFASAELAATYRLPTAAQRVLPPIPAGWPQFARWRSAFATRPRVYYAGFVWPEQLPLLRRIAQTLAGAGAVLVLLARATPELTEFCRANPVMHVAPFASNREALAHLAAEAAGVLVSYADTVAQMPWSATSFPSKLVEYAHLGLPSAIVAPHGSAVGRWAQRGSYTEYFAPDETDRLAAWARDLRSEPAWGRRAEPARILAGGEFNPEVIQAAFAAGLLRT